MSPASHTLIYQRTGTVSMADVGGIAGEKLKSFIERIERLEEEKKAIAGDIKEIFAEAKGHGFDTKIMRQVIKLRRMDRAEVEEQETLLDLYLQALGMTESEQAPQQRAAGRR
jgi:uncharacterized protein (UPF0335 family)